MFLLAVQHERKPIVDRKEAHKSSTSENDQEIMSQGKSRMKKEVNNDSVNYLSFFQLNPLLMHAASNVNPPQSFQPSTKIADSVGVKMEDSFADDLSDERFNMNSDTSALFDTVLEQKQLSDTFEMISLIESCLVQGGFEPSSNGTYDDDFGQSIFNNLTDDAMTQFKIQIPNLLPKMHFVCEMGSRVLFKTFDWLKDMQILKNFDTEVQVEMLQQNWAELVVLGLAQVICTSPQASQMKQMVVSSLVNYVKSLIICSANEVSQVKTGAKGDAANPASGHKLKKMLMNIMTINKFIDMAGQLDLDVVEFAHLRVLCLFNPNKVVYSSDPKLKSFHQRVAANLQQYLQQQREKSQDSIHQRVIAMYQALSVLPSFDSKIIEKLFFNILVDCIRVENIIPYIIKLNAESGDLRVKQEKELDINDENNSHSMNSDDQQRYYNNYSGDEKFAN